MNIPPMSKKFTMNFWIRNAQNVKWSDLSSVIHFPPLEHEGVRVFFKKENEHFSAYILHPQNVFRIVRTDIQKYIGKDTMVTLIFDGKKAILYLNAEQVAESSETPVVDSILQGDYVMVDIKEHTLSNINKSPSLRMVMVGEVKDRTGEGFKIFFPEAHEETKIPYSDVVIPN